MNKKTVILGVVFLVILIILIVILVGRTPSTDKSTQVSLIWWNLFEPEENIKPLIDEYTKNNPNIKIQYVQLGQDSIANYKEKLLIDLNDKEVISSPDIFPISNNWLGSFENNIIKAPTSLFSSSEIDDFYPIVKSDFYKAGKVSALPLYLDGLALIYNKTRLKEAGLIVPNKYWSDFQIEAQKLTVRNSSSKITKPGFSALLFDNAEFSFDTLNLLLMQSGVKFYDQAGAIMELGSQSEADSALEFYNYFVNDSLSTWNKEQPKDIVSFLEGNLAMYIAPSWRIINILNYNTKYNLNLSIGVTSIPQLLGRDEVSWASYWGLTVSKDSQYSDEAWKFIKYLTQAEQLKKLNDTIIANGRPIGIIYPRKSMLSDIENDPYLGVYATSLLNAKSWDMYDYDEMKMAFKNALTNDISVKSLDNAINSVISKKTLTTVN